MGLSAQIIEDVGVRIVVVTTCHDDNDDDDDDDDDDADDDDDRRRRRIGSNKDTEGCDLSIRDILVLVST